MKSWTTTTTLAAAFLAAVAASPAAAQTVPVTPDNFRRAETHLYFGNSVKEGGFGKFNHIREPMPIDHQTVIRANRDTLYSSAVFDLDAGAVTVTLPDAGGAGGRFMSMQVIDEEQYVPAVHYGAGRHTFTRDGIGTRYVMLGIRTLVDPADSDDVKQVHVLQDAIGVEQPGGPGKFGVPAWDPVSQKKVRDALVVLSTTLPDTKRTFGRREDVDPVRHLIGTAYAWGGNPERDALYLNVTPPENDGRTVYRLTVREVPVDGFWSVSVYGADGYYHKNDRDAYTVNNLTAKKDADGSVTIQFGGDAGDAPNVLPITPGWNYMVRLYRPRAEVLDGTWRFPEAAKQK